MARPKRGTAAGDLATERWRNTMIKKYGKKGFQEMIRENGAKGGRAGTTGGFYGNYAMAQLAGAKGGRRSIRGWKLCGKMYKNNQTTLYYEHRINQELVLVYNETLGKKWFYRRGVLYAES